MTSLNHESRLNGEIAGALERAARE